MKIFNKLLENYEKYHNEDDKKLIDAGWRETGGIALFTNTKYPNLALDHNTDNIWVLPVRERGAFNTSSDDFLTVVKNYDELLKWMKTKEAKEWMSPHLINWGMKYLKSIAANAEIGSKVIFNHDEYDDQGRHKSTKKLTGKLTAAGGYDHMIVKVGDKDYSVSHSMIVNHRHDPEKKAWFFTDQE